LPNADGACIKALRGELIVAYANDKANGKV
jgi:hypothetical protein